MTGILPRRPSSNPDFPEFDTDFRIGRPDRRFGENGLNLKLLAGTSEEHQNEEEGAAEGLLGHGVV